MVLVSRRAPGWACFVGRLAVCLGLGGTFAGRASAERATAQTSARTAETPPPLPRPTDIRLARPTEKTRDALVEWLSRVTSDKREVRAAAAKQLAGASADLLPAIAVELAEISSRADKPAMKSLLLSSRKDAREELADEKRSRGERGKVTTPDYLELLLERPEPDSATWRGLVRVVAMSRMLRHLGSTAAARQLIEIYVRFGEFLRVDTQRALEGLGDSALPALIEAQLHPAPKVAKWATQRLELGKRSTPSEAIQVADPIVLGDVLRAYGRIRDPDAARILVAFAGTERLAVRQGAREGIVSMGEVAHWQLREHYENLLGKRPLREWSWERTARELFAELDRARLAGVHHAFDAGMSALAERNWEKMKEHFDEVLARSPSFDRGEAIGQGYLAYARANLDKDRERALDAVRRAERILGDESSRTEAQSLRLTLEAEGLLGRGFADQVLYRRALELMPENERAKDGLARIELGEVAETTRTGRYLGAAVIVALALAALGYLGFRRLPLAPPRAPKTPVDPMKKPEPPS